MDKPRIVYIHGDLSFAGRGAGSQPWRKNSGALATRHSSSFFRTP